MAASTPTFPGFAAKHGHDCLINPEAFVEYHRTEGAYRDLAAPTAVILCYHRGLAEHVLRGREHTKVAGFFGDTYLLGQLANRVALVANFGIGSPAAAVMLEDAIALGATEVLSIGTCGALHPDLAIGDIVICERALRDEGTSHHYLPAGEPAEADAALTARLASALVNAGAEPMRGTSWTVDAPYRETVAEARHYQREGVAVVEMEASALFAVGQHRGVAVASALTVSDSLADLSWTPAFHGDETMRGLETLFAAALDTLAPHATR